MMASSLGERVQEVERRAKRLVWLHAAARFVGVTVAVVVGLGLVDYMLRLNDTLARWLLSLAGVGLVLWACVRVLLPAVRFRPSRVFIARRIERRFPELGERLSNAVALADGGESSSAAGSLNLRRAVVAEAETVASRLDFSQVIETRLVRRSALAAAAALFAAGVMAAADPPAARLAGKHLLAPWENTPWPRRHELALVDAPRRLAAGDQFEIAVIDRRGWLPPSVELLLRHDRPGGPETETKEMTRQGDRMVYRLENVQSSFAYRARGGDDDEMPWHLVTVHEPPKVVELTTHVEPPAYSGLAPHAGGRVVKALRGSTLRLNAKLDKPIRTAAARAETPGIGLPNVEVAADGRSFTAPGDEAPWLIDSSGAIGFTWTDREGLQGGRDLRIEITAIEDEPPAITWDRPAEQSVATALAVAPIAGLAKDDLSVRAIALHYRPLGSDEDEAREIELYAAGDASDRTGGGGPQGEDVPFQYEFDLSRVENLAPGDVLLLRLSVEDHKPQLVAADERRLSIVSQEELVRRLAVQQEAILQQLADALRVARQSHGQMSALQARVEKAGSPGPEELDQLQAAQHQHRRLQGLLADTAEGVEGKIDALLRQWMQNRIEDQGIAQRLDRLASGVGDLNQATLPRVEQQLGAAYKAARDALDTASGPTTRAVDAVLDELRPAIVTQAEVVQTLETLLGTLADWDSFHRLAQELEQIRTLQEHLAEETERLRLVAIASSESEPAQRAAAQSQSQAQLELARQVEKLQLQMEEMLGGLSSDDSEMAQQLAAAVTAAQRHAVAGQMRQAATQLRQHRFGQAQAAEQAAIDGLLRVASALSSREGQEIQKSALALGEAAVQLSDLIDRQSQVLAQTQSLHRSRDPRSRLTASQRAAFREMARQESDLFAEVDRLRLQFGSSEAIGFALRSAVERMRWAAAELQSQQSGVAVQQAEQAALRRLQQVLEAILPDETATEGPAAPPDEPRAPKMPGDQPEALILAAEIRLLALVQGEINERTAALETARREKGSFTAPQQQELDLLAHDQRHLAEMALKIFQAMAGSED